MKSQVLVATALVGFSLLVGATARGEEKTLTPQQQKMSSCSTQAKEKNLKGDARKTFLSDCLKAEKTSHNAQQEKMKDCNKQATGKKGDERKAFMKKCLSGDAA